MNDFISADAAQLEQAANRLAKIKESLTQQARELRGTSEAAPTFRGREADRFRQNVRELARQTERLAEAANEQSRGLKTLAQRVRELNSHSRR